MRRGTNFKLNLPRYLLARTSYISAHQAQYISDGGLLTSQGKIAGQSRMKTPIVVTRRLRTDVPRRYTAAQYETDSTKNKRSTKPQITLPCGGYRSPEALLHQALYVNSQNQ